MPNGYPSCRFFDLIEPFIEVLRQNLDVDYFLWLFWLFAPILIVFIIPLILAVFVYGCAFFLHVYKQRNYLREAYSVDVWHGARMTIAAFWDAQGWIWHGHEVIGLENIPDQGPALIVYYHGTLPLDVYYLIAKVLIYKRRLIHCVGDRFLTYIPGWKTLMEVFCITSGTVESCTERLKEGNLLCVAPGGVREALFSDSDTYKLLWSNRVGFAKVAVNAETCVIPMFTENCREVFRTPYWARWLLRDFYERTRIPLVPIYGGFPVKMRTYVGKPIKFDPNLEPEELRNKVSLFAFTRFVLSYLISLH
uniref:Phospholipid/glycerol acyltransferase domain-containing protein n=1 Tax=Romanomermis culicivorax TaxID=13658 RepID=A0A915KKA9_ROMCU